LEIQEKSKFYGTEIKLRINAKYKTNKKFKFEKKINAESDN